MWMFSDLQPVTWKSNISQLHHGWNLSPWDLLGPFTKRLSWHHLKPKEEWTHEVQFLLNTDQVLGHSVMLMTSNLLWAEEMTNGKKFQKISSIENILFCLQIFLFYIDCFYPGNYMNISTNLIVLVLLFSVLNWWITWIFGNMIFSILKYILLSQSIMPIAELP